MFKLIVGVGLIILIFLGVGFFGGWSLAVSEARQVFVPQLKSCAVGLSNVTTDWLDRYEVQIVEVNGSEVVE